MRARVRPLELVRAAWALALLAAPARVVRVVGGVAPDHRAVVVARILGGRHLVQALGSGLAPGPEVLAVGAWVDGVHSLTAFALAARDPSRRRVGLIDASIAGCFGLLSRADARRGWAARVDATGPLPWTETVATAVARYLPGAGR